MAMQLWLGREGHTLAAEDAELVATAIGIASGKLSIEEVTAWLEAHVARQ